MRCICFQSQQFYCDTVPYKEKLANLLEVLRCKTANSTVTSEIAAQLVTDALMVGAMGTRDEEALEHLLARMQALPDASTEQTEATEQVTTKKRNRLFKKSI